MHGIRRVRQTQEEREVSKRKELAKIEEFNALTQRILARKKENDWSDEAFQLTTKLLQINPEFYTVWNYRRNILLKGKFPDSSPEQVHELLEDELSMTMTALKARPKVYWIWNHRMWCLEHVPNGPASDGESGADGWKQTVWNKELFVVEKMLDADSRNFQAWNYRRFVLASMPTPRSESSELAYTSKKIEANFSNFSAWHQRSKTLTSLWSQGKLDEPKSREADPGLCAYHYTASFFNHRCTEFELLRNAMYTDPNDQSVWMYHRWLVGTGGGKNVLEREISAIQELLDEQPDSKWCMESIVYYKQLLLKNYAADVDTRQLTKECKDVLKDLETLDPMRRMRYRELAGVIASTTS